MKNIIDDVLFKKNKDLNDLFESEWDINLEKHYMKLWKIICDGKTILLPPIHLKIKEKQLFYSKSDKKNLFLGPTWKMYLIPSKKDEKGRVLVYSPYTFGEGQVFLVPKDLIVHLGYN